MHVSKPRKVHMWAHAHRRTCTPEPQLVHAPRQLLFLYHPALLPPPPTASFQRQRRWEEGCFFHPTPPEGHQPYSKYVRYYVIYY